MWVFRLQQEQKVSVSSHFLTLTYSEENLPHTQCGRPTLVRRDHQLFMKRLRKYEKNAKIKYYAVGEYGSNTERPHYHSIIFNVENVDNIPKAWQLGNVQVDKCTTASMAYVAKYVNKQTKFKDRNDPRTPEFSLMSKGLGSAFMTKAQRKYMKQHLNPFITHVGGQKVALPRYYKDKIFTDAEKEIINTKSKLHYEEQKPFESFKHQQDYVADQFRKRDKIARAKRNKI